VQAFLHNKLSFTGIAEVIEGVLEKTANHPVDTLSRIKESDAEARRIAHEIMAGRGLAH